MPKHLHKLSNVNLEAKTADCATCGPEAALYVHKTTRICALSRAQSKRKTKHGELYGITPQDYFRMTTAQGGVCAICGSKPDGPALAVDHCHDTYKVRGLLCRSCNLGLGFFRDDPQRMLKAIQYLSN